MSNRNIDIFYIATGIYASYVDNFINTVHYFFPRIKKIIHIISDNLDYLNGKQTDDYQIILHTIIDLPYPIIPLLKTKLISNFSDNSMNYIFYFDADTIFIEKNDEYWNELMEQIDNNQILMSLHPGNHYPNYEISDKSSAHMSYGEQLFSIISSFWGGNKDEISKFISKMGELIKYDLTTHENGHQCHYIPPLFDQDYANKIVNSDNSISFLLRYYISIDWLRNDFDRVEENFIIQKYDIQRKFKTKNME